MLNPLPLGRHRVWPPVVLAPMAGITNIAYRRLCREHGAGLYVNEMVTARGLVEGDPATWAMLAFDPDERPRSLQLYATDPAAVAAAARLVVAEDLADHIDLNLGCPAPKVTRKGGGAALPYKRNRLAAVLAAAVGGADGRVPVTVKMRLGIDADTLTYLDAARIAESEGCAWVGLHARTAAQHYSGAADWSAIARLRDHVGIPVLGNGDIWEAADAVAMTSRTGCHGVIVGRGCLGRPWLFANLAAVFDGRRDPGHPGLSQVLATLRRHAELMCRQMGESRGCREIRKHIAWYLKGFAVGADVRRALGLVADLASLDELLARIDVDQQFPAALLGTPRGRGGSPRRVALPAGWLDDPDDLPVDAGETGAPTALAAVAGG